MVIFFIFISFILISLLYSLFLFIFNYHLPDLKFVNDNPCDVNEVVFNPRNLLENKKYFQKSIDK